MKQFLSFLNKEFIHILRDSRALLILLVMPLVLICIFGFALSTEVKDNYTFVIDEVQTPESHALIQRIDANKYFIVTNDREKADVTIILNEEKGMQILADGSEPNLAQSRVSYLAQIASSIASENSDRINLHMLFNPQMKSEYNFVPGIIGMIILLICAMMSSISIVREKELGTMEILLASPLKPFIIIAAKLIPYFIVSCVNIITILLLSKYAFGLPIGTVGAGWTTIISFFVLSMVYIIVALSLGLLISCAVKTQIAAMLFSLLLIVPSVFLSGLVFPLESMHIGFRIVSVIVPARWFMEAAKRLLIQGVEFTYIVKEIAVLCLLILVFMALSIKLFKTHLE